MHENMNYLIIFNYKIIENNLGGHLYKDYNINDLKTWLMLLDKKMAMRRRKTEK